MSENTVSLDKTETVEEIRALLAPTGWDQVGTSVPDSELANGELMRANRDLREQVMAQAAEVARLKAEIVEANQNAANYAQQRSAAFHNLRTFKEGVAEALFEYEESEGIDLEGLYEALGVERPTKEIELVIVTTVTVTMTVPSNVTVDDITDDFSVDVDGQVLYSGEHEADMQAEIQSIQEN